MKLQAASAVLCTVALWTFPLIAQEKAKPQNEEYLEFNYGQETGGDNWIEAIQVTEPDYRSSVKGKVTVKFTAEGMKRATARLWQQPTEKEPSPWGHDTELTPGGLDLDVKGKASFSFDADQFPSSTMRAG